MAKEMIVSGVCISECVCVFMRTYMCTCNSVHTYAVIRCDIITGRVVERWYVTEPFFSVYQLIRNLSVSVSCVLSAYRVSGGENLSAQRVQHQNKAIYHQVISYYNYNYYCQARL